MGPTWRCSRPAPVPGAAPSASSPWTATGAPSSWPPPHNRVSLDSSSSAPSVRRTHHRRRVFSVYLRAKADADDAVRASDREWTIVRPGGLTDDPGSGCARIDTEPFRGRVSREDVATVLAEILREPRSIGTILYVNGGDRPGLGVAGRSARGNGLVAALTRLRCTRRSLRRSAVRSNKAKPRARGSDALRGPTLRRVSRGCRGGPRRASSLRPPARSA